MANGVCRDIKDAKARDMIGEVRELINNLSGENLEEYKREITAMFNSLDYAIRDLRTDHNNDTSGIRVDIYDLTYLLNELKTRVETIETEGVDAEIIADINTRLTSLQKDITSCNLSIANMDTKYATDTDVDGVKSRVTTLEQKVETLENNGGGSGGSIDTSDLVTTTEFNTAINQINTDMATLNSNQETLNTNMETLETQLGNKASQTDLDALEEVVAGLQTGGGSGGSSDGGTSEWKKCATLTSSIGLGSSQAQSNSPFTKWWYATITNKVSFEEGESIQTLFNHKCVKAYFNIANYKIETPLLRYNGLYGYPHLSYSFIAKGKYYEFAISTLSSFVGLDGNFWTNDDNISTPNLNSLEIYYKD